MNRTHFAVPNAMFVYNLTQDIPLIRTLSSVPRVSGLESFHFSWAPHVADHIDVASSSPLILFNLCYCTPIYVYTLISNLGSVIGGCLHLESHWFMQLFL